MLAAAAAAVAGGAAWWLLHAPRSVPAPLLTLSRLTSDTGLTADPALSPDGTTVTFRSDRQGGGIYVVSALGGPARVIAPRMETAIDHGREAAEP